MTDYELGRDLWLWIDPSRACNIACELCYTRESHGKSFLSEDTLLGIAANLNSAPGLRVHEITFNWRGEPLMNKDFPELLAIVCMSFADCRVQFHTNCMLISEGVARRLAAIDAPFFIYLSIDGGTQASHDSNRGSGSFQRAVRGAHRLLDARAGRRWPHITLYQLDLGIAESEYDPDFLRLAERADQWQRVTPVVKSGAARPESDRLRSPEELWTMDSGQPSPAGPCFWAGYSLSIAPNADVSVCILNQVSQPDGRIGNLLSESAGIIIDRAANLRRQMQSHGRDNIAHCRNCKKLEGRPRPPNVVDDLKLRVLSE